MIDPNQIARGIACKWQVKYGICEGIPDLEEAIAAALLEYGEAREKEDRAKHNDRVEEVRREIEAEGYQRGKAESCVAEYRRGVEETYGLHRPGCNHEHLAGCPQRGTGEKE